MMMAAACCLRLLLKKGRRMDESVHRVRENESGMKGVPPHDMIRLKMRVDLVLDEQVIDWSVIAWRHPQAHCFYNRVDTRIGMLFAMTALDELNQSLCEIFDLALRVHDPLSLELPPVTADIRRSALLSPTEHES